MNKIIAVHSYKGGTGKTLLSVNLAATFAKNGKKVCIFDLDFGPQAYLPYSKPQTQVSGSTTT